jgi:hypothetical protein
MGTPLTGQTPAETYKDLLKLSNSNNGIDGTLRYLGDGEGQDSTVKISTSGIDVSGTIYLSGTVLSASVDQINKLNRTVVDGIVEASKVLVADNNRGLSTLGGDIDLLSNSAGLSNGVVSNLGFGPFGYVMNDLGSTSGIVINPASGSIFKAVINSTTTALSFQIPNYVLNDYYASTPRAYWVRLFVVQDATGGRSITWPATGQANGNLYFPSGQWTSVSERYPKISGVSYSPSSGEIDIFDFWTYDYGVNWLGNRAASGINRNG